MRFNVDNLIYFYLYISVYSMFSDMYEHVHTIVVSIIQLIMV